LPGDMRWTDLFDVVVVSACKPEFFSPNRRPIYEIATADGMLREGARFEEGRAYAGGNAQAIERCFGHSGPQMLYVGDHLFTDVNMAKRGLSWRTCLILQELEEEMAGLASGQPAAQQLTRLKRRHDLEASFVNHLRLRLLTCAPSGGHSHAAPSQQERALGLLAQSDEFEAAMERAGGACAMEMSACNFDERERLQAAIEAFEDRLAESEKDISALQENEGNHVNRIWGYMSRAGFADKSHLMRQIEKYADIYTSRVCNLQPYTPFKPFLSQRQSLAHFTTSYSGRPLMEHWQITDTEMGDDVCDTQQSPPS